MALNPGERVGPYEIVSSLGAGAMGVVYKARDPRLNRFVALKTLAESTVSDASVRWRFLREAQAASQLNHPNIVTIHETLEHNGVCFLVMEYITGSTLDAMLADKPLPLAEAIRYALQIADGLEAAHAAGIIHRDLKPANIMVTADGRVKLLDFGLARITRPEFASDASVTRSLEGTVLGTAPYMSPEQAQGRSLDARSDIFSLGCVLYELFSGKRAFRRDTWIGTLAAILDSEPTPIRQVMPSLPPAIENIIPRCLRKDAENRFQTVRELKHSLRELTAPTLAVPSPPVLPDKPSIAVLPFANLSTDKENEYFSDGLAEEILNALTKIPELRVIARASAFAFRGQEHDLATIGQRLRVQTILEGSVRRAGNRIRITSQLIKVEDASHLWSERYDRELTDVFAIQDDISQEIAAALEVKLTLRDTPPTNIEAYQDYLKGIYWYQRYTAQSLVRAREAFERALAHDPDYALAHAGLATFYYSLGALGIRRMSSVGPLAKAAAEKALALDSGLNEAHGVLGLLAGAVQYDWQTAKKHFEQAIAADPVPPLERSRYALYYLLPLRRYDEAVEQYQRALETDPLSMMVLFGISFALYCDQRYAEATEHAGKAVDLYPDYWLVHFAMGVAQSRIAQIEQGIASLEKALQLSPLFALATGYLAALYAAAGNTAGAEALIAELHARKSQTYVSSSSFAIYYAATGSVDLMFASLEAAFDEREPFLTRTDAEPYFWPYRDDPRYQDLMARMRLQ